MIKNRELHYQAPQTIKKFQEDRMKETLIYVAEHSPFYKRMFIEYNINISEINTIEDLQLFQQLLSRIYNRIIMIFFVLIHC